jgi:glycerol-3-phosphate dehydrogenase (NAD(P)+)
VNELAIIGAGSWGTALAIVLAPRFSRIRLWVYEKDLAERMRATRVNDLYLPGFCLPASVTIETDFSSALPGAEMLLSVMPSHLVRSLYQQMLPWIEPPMICVSATKGLENGTLRRASEVIGECLSCRFEPRIAVISGPTFAREVARGDPTALVVASTDRDLAASVQARFSGPTFRLYTSGDPVGVEIGGAVKNVVAIGAGVCHGLGLGSNTQAALITRGLAEMTRLAVSLGGHSQTLAGLAGLGDLVLTCSGELSRNRAVGLELAKGRKLEEIVRSMKMVAEGVKTTAATADLARRQQVDMPICTQMFEMLNFGLPPREALRKLMERSLKGE